MKDILEQALLAPLEMKDLILSKTFSIDKELSIQLFNDTENITELEEYNKIIEKYLSI
jgi:hypothetical protein